MRGALWFDPDDLKADPQPPPIAPGLAGLAGLALSSAPAAFSHPVRVDPEAGAAEALAAAAAEGLAALAAPDPDLAAEREAIAATMRAEAAGALPVLPEARHRDHLAGLERSALQRPPSWADAAAVPPPGAWCGACSRNRPEWGGRWWAPVNPRIDGLGLGPGWRCMTCHPPPPGGDVREAVT